MSSHPNDRFPCLPVHSLFPLFFLFLVILLYLALHLPCLGLILRAGKCWRVGCSCVRLGNRGNDWVLGACKWGEPWTLMLPFGFWLVRVSRQDSSQSPCLGGKSLTTSILEVNGGSRLVSQHSFSPFVCSIVPLLSTTPGACSPETFFSNF